MDTLGERNATYQAAPLSGFTGARVRSIKTPRFVKVLLFAAVAVGALVLVEQIDARAARRWNARPWMSFGDGYRAKSLPERRWNSNMHRSIGRTTFATTSYMRHDGRWRFPALPTWVRGTAARSWSARALEVELSPPAPLLFDSSAGTGHCDYGYSCRVHLYTMETAGQTMVIVGYQIQALLQNTIVPASTQARIAQMADSQVASIAVELVAHVSKELEPPVCGVDLELVKLAIKETADDVLRTCLDTNADACYTRKEVLRFPSASLQKTYMLPTRQCSSRRYCRAVLELSSVNNCVSTSAGYRIFSVDDTVRTVDEATKRRVGSTSRSVACEWANKLIANVQKEFDLSCALDLDSVCDGMLAGARQVVTCSHTDKEECTSLSAVVCA